MKILLKLMLSFVVFLNSCDSEKTPKKAVVLYHASPVYELTLSSENLHKLSCLFIKIREKRIKASTVNGQLVLMQWNNGECLTGYLITILYNDGSEYSAFLFKNKPFIFHEPGSHEYNFKDMLIDKDITELRRLIPGWNESN